MADGPDYRRDDYVDEQHFVWRINPVSFMRETGLRLAAKPPAPPSPEPALVNKPDPGVTKFGDHGAPFVDSVDTQRPPVVNQPPGTVTKATPAVDTKPSPPGLEREMIDLLKSQVQVKDGQIRELTDQNRNLSDTNLKLIGQTVQQSKEIQTLLRLTGGRTEPSGTVTKSGNQGHGSVDQGGNETGDPVDKVGYQPAGDAAVQGSELAA